MKKPKEFPKKEDSTTPRSLTWITLPKYRVYRWHFSGQVDDVSSKKGEFSVPKGDEAYLEATKSSHESAKHFTFFSMECHAVSLLCCIPIVRNLPMETTGTETEAQHWLEKQTCKNYITKNYIKIP